MNENKNYISIDDRFAIEALLTSLRSKDPNCQVGAVLVSKDNRILSTGYNGTPNGISDKDFPWQKEGSFLHMGNIPSFFRFIFGDIWNRILCHII